MSTHAIRTGARGIPRIDEVDRHTLQRSLIDDKRPQLREGPRMECCALRPPSLHPRANVRQVFQRYRPLRAFGLRNNPFGETVVDVFGELAFLAGKLFQTAMATFRAFLLQLTAQSAMSIANILDRFAGMDFAIAIGSDVGHAQVDTERAVNIDRFGCRDFTRRKQIPATVNVGKVGLATAMLEQFALAFTTHEGDRLSPDKCPDRDQRVGQGIRQDAIVVRNGAVGSKRALCLSVEFVGIGNFGDTTDDHLRGQLKHLAHVVVHQPLQWKLAKGACFPCHLADVVASSVGRLKRALERAGLFGRGKQFQLCNQFHRVRYTTDRTSVQLLG